MPRFPKEQLNYKKVNIELLDVLIVLWSFSSGFLHAFLFFTNRQSNSGQLAIVYIIVAVLSIFLCFKYFSKWIPISFLFVLFLFIFIGISFVITRIRYGSGEPMFVSEFKSFFAMAICIMLLSLLVFWRNKKDINLGIVFATIIILTLVSFLSLFRGDKVTSGGYISDSSGLTYQNISYFSANAFGLTLFHLNEKSKISKISPLNILLYIVLFIAQFSSCLLSGGRGGLVLFFVLFVYSFVVHNGIKKSYKILLPTLIIILIAWFLIPRIIAVLDINIKGLTRIMKFLNRGFVDEGRSNLFSQSIDAFLESPVIGNGIGSIFFYLHTYSHNLFLDILSETGLIGLIIFTIVFVIFIRKIIILFKQGSLYRLLTILFVCGFSLNLFSGYFWGNQNLWLPLVVILISPVNFKPEECNTTSEEINIEADEINLESEQ